MPEKNLVLLWANSKFPKLKLVDEEGEENASEGVVERDGYRADRKHWERKGLEFRLYSADSDISRRNLSTSTDFCQQNTTYTVLNTI